MMLERQNKDMAGKIMLLETFQTDHITKIENRETPQTDQMTKLEIRIDALEAAANTPSASASVSSATGSFVVLKNPSLL